MDKIGSNLLGYRTYIKDASCAKDNDDSKTDEKDSCIDTKTHSDPSINSYKIVNLSELMNFEKGVF